MRISIALATYNGGLYLKEQLDSIANQSLQPDELVISDDHSIDNTLDIIKDFSNSVSFDIKIYENPSKGFNTNFEYALKNTTGDIIFICDQDDYWCDNKIKSSVHFFDENPDKDLIIHNLEFCDSNLKPIGQNKIDRFKFYNKGLDGYVTGMATAVKRKFLETCFPFPIYTNYDSWIHLCAVLLDRKMINPEVLALYRRHNSNATIESIINISKIPTLFNKISNKIKYNDLNDLKNHIDLLLFALNYLENIDSCIDVNNEILNNSMSKIKTQILRCKERYILLDKSFVKRFIFATKLLFNNGYSGSSGVYSYLKDIFYLWK